MFFNKVGNIYLVVPRAPRGVNRGDPRTWAACDLYRFTFDKESDEITQYNNAGRASVIEVGDGVTDSAVLEVLETRPNWTKEVAHSQNAIKPRRNDAFCIMTEWRLFEPDIDSYSEAFTELFLSRQYGKVNERRLNLKWILTEAEFERLPPFEEIEAKGNYWGEERSAA